MSSEARCRIEESLSGIDTDPLAAWLQCMRRGDWASAWPWVDAQLPQRAVQPCWDWPRHLQYVWTGASLADRRVLVRCYHGLGDTLQFIRYMPLLKAIAREVTVWVQPALLELLHGFEGIDRLLPLHDGTPEVEYDVDVEIMELPHVFRTTLATLPCRTPYLRADPLPLPRGNERPAVGLVWQAGEWNPSRSIGFSRLSAWKGLDVEWYILQPKPAEAGWDGSFGHLVDAFEMPRYARAVSAMDLLVTIDSMPAHLAGALGVPTWTLLAADADWRWMDGREDSPWYPGMRLYRQRRAGDWDELVERVGASLAQFARGWKPSLTSAAAS
ncbi:MAG TPA: hypothetical protein VM687_16690 [Stenotrophomonas sp.]|nr:hypothetical protein [Stenotrophomonas sp.]